MIYLNHNAATPVLPEVFEAIRSRFPALWEGTNVGYTGHGKSEKECGGGGAGPARRQMLRW